MKHITADQHLKNAKDKANELAGNGDLYGAVQLLNHELGQHNETKHLANAVAFSDGRTAAASGDPGRVRAWINSHALGAEENRA